MPASAKARATGVRAAPPAHDPDQEAVERPAGRRLITGTSPAVSRLGARPRARARPVMAPSPVFTFRSYWVRVRLSRR